MISSQNCRFILLKVVGEQRRGCPDVVNEALLGADLRHVLKFGTSYNCRVRCLAAPRVPALQCCKHTTIAPATNWRWHEGFRSRSGSHPFTSPSVFSRVPRLFLSPSLIFLDCPPFTTSRYIIFSERLRSRQLYFARPLNHHVPAFLFSHLSSCLPPPNAVLELRDPELNRFPLPPFHNWLQSRTHQFLPPTRTPSDLLLFCPTPASRRTKPHTAVPVGMGLTARTSIPSLTAMSISVSCGR